MNLKMEEYAHTLNLSSDDNRLMRYLKGETIDVEDLIPAKAKGWHLVCGLRRFPSHLDGEKSRTEL